MITGVFQPRPLGEVSGPRPRAPHRQGRCPPRPPLRPRRRSAGRSDVLELVGEAVVVGADPRARRLLPETHQVLQPLGEAQELLVPVGHQQGRWGGRGPGEGSGAPSPVFGPQRPPPLSRRLCGPIRQKPHPALHPGRAPEGYAEVAPPERPSPGYLPSCCPHTYPSIPQPAELSAALKAAGSRSPPARRGPGQASPRGCVEEAGPPIGPRRLPASR